MLHPSTHCSTSFNNLMCKFIDFFFNLFAVQSGTFILKKKRELNTRICRKANPEKQLLETNPEKQLFP